MALPTSHIRLGALFVLAAARCILAGDPSPLAPSPGAGTFQSLSVEPPRIAVRGADRTARLVVSGVTSSGEVRDLTREASFEVENPAIVSVAPGGLLSATGDGSTRVRAYLAAGSGLEAWADVDATNVARPPPINFPNEIVPIFSKYGCNSGGCHGKSGGQNGFQLSLFGFTPEVDYASLTRDSRGRRVFPAAPEHSLLLRKATGDLPHGGGARFEQGTPDYKAIYRWMRSGLPYGSPTDPTIESISVLPAARTLPLRSQQQLVVIVRFSDGSTEDITERAQYSADASEHLAVSSSGLVSALELPGQGTILVRYRGQVATFRAMVPSGLDVTRLPRPPARSFVDEHVGRTLELLGIQSSELCTDAEFLRRACVDITGSIPSPEEAESFLSDSEPRKRENLVDRLLERPGYASYFALEWADLLRNRRGGEERAAPLTLGFHGWIYEAIAANRPFDQVVREILCAEGSPEDNPAVAWYRSLENPKQLVDDAAQVFLGTRIQCARCHHHPFERWGQDDYWRFATFFARVTRRNDSNSRSFTVSLGRGDSRTTDDEPTSASFQKTYVGLKLPGGPEVHDSPDEDPRQALADWLASPQNPLFARCVVNRYWKHFFGHGIVEPEDDLRETNPPSNPALLDALAKDFLQSGYDLKRLVRTIATSATYQLSSIPNDSNRADRQNFSRHHPRRLDAEVLLDAIDSVTARKTRFQGMPAGARAIDLPDETSRNYFLEVFGKPDRSSACACERSGDVTLPQVIHLLNSREIQEKLSHDAGRSASYAKDSRPLEGRIRELFLAAFGRSPDADELRRAEEHFAAAAGAGEAPGASRKAWEDLIWALLNAKEFCFVR